MPDWLGQAKVAVSGIATVIIPNNNTSVVWEIQQVGVTVGPASTGGNVAIFKNNNLVAPTAALAPLVNQFGAIALGQTAAGLPYVYIYSSDTLQIVVSAATAGDSMTVRAQYRELSLVDPDVRGR
jgi:hypothetical protein